MEILYTSDKKKKAFKQSKSQKGHFSLEILEKKRFALKKKQISLDLTNEDIKSKHKKNMEIAKTELKRLDVIKDESPVEPKNPQITTLGTYSYSV